MMGQTTQFVDLWAHTSTEAHPFSVGDDCASFSILPSCSCRDVSRLCHGGRACAGYIQPSLSKHTQGNRSGEARNCSVVLVNALNPCSIIVSATWMSVKRYRFPNVLAAWD